MSTDELKALERAEHWVGKLIANGGHHECVNPNDAVATLALINAIINKYER